MRVVWAAALAAAAVVAITVGFMGTPGRAGPCEPEAPDADGRIGFGGISAVGNDTFNSSGAGQTQSFFTNSIEDPPTTGTWKIRFENERDNPKTIVVGALLLGEEASFKARFLRGGNNVTDKVLNGDLKYRNVAGGALTRLLKLKMTPRQSAVDGDELDALVEGRYLSQDACEADVVRGHIEINNDPF